MCFISVRKHLTDSFLVWTASMMEEDLQKLVEHAEPNPSYNIIITENTSRLQIVFTPPLVFAGGSCHYEISLMKLETYYSFPNCKATNNCVKVSIDKGTSWKLITIPIGCYEINAINNTLQR